VAARVNQAGMRRVKEPRDWQTYWDVEGVGKGKSGEDNGTATRRVETCEEKGSVKWGRPK
jgi:hypothetical protein